MYERSDIASAIKGCKRGGIKRINKGINAL